MTSYLIGLVGTGIGPSLSPALHEREASRLGLPYVYRLIEVAGAGEAGEMVRAARRLGFDGLNITHPCKRAVLPHLDERRADAATLGAVSPVVFDGGRAVGHNTDWTGFAESFTRGLPGAPTGRVTLLGAGGAGAAVGHALLTLGTGELTVVDADPERGRTLAGELNARFGAGRARPATTGGLAEPLPDADGLVHATPTGMAGHPGLPLPAELLRPDLWVADIVYRPLETELLRRARALGCRTLDGGGMVVFQAAHAFHLFTGREPDTGRMLAHL